MEYVNTKKFNSGFTPFLLIGVLFPIVMAIMIIIDGFDFSLYVLLFISLIFIFPVLFFLDIFLWRTIGKEIIYTQGDKLIIKKVNRVRPRKKTIQFKKIEDIYLWEKNDTYSLMSAFWDWDKQGKICVQYDDGNKYYAGRNLNDIEAEGILNMLKSEIPNTPANPTSKSKIVEWLLLIMMILVIFL
jgi:hypothetical protein